MADLTSKPEGLHCESTEQTFVGRVPCMRPATHVYGPECEAETGQLMYLCRGHAQLVDVWRSRNPNEPVECPTHGRLGPVKSYLILKEM